MSEASRRPMSIADFLEWEERQEFRWEYDGCAPVAMTGCTAAHSGIQRNVLVALYSRLRGGPCLPYASALKVILAHSIRYPDATVVCGPYDPRATATDNAVVVFEVLSPSTSSYDRIVKNREYRATPSIRRYVMLEQDRVGAIVFARADDGGWTGSFHAAGESLPMPEIDIEVSLDELYADVPLDD